MAISVTFFPDSDHQYAVKITSDCSQVLVSLNGTESQFRPTSNTYQYCNYIIDDNFVVPVGMTENEAIIERLKKLILETTPIYR